MESLRRKNAEKNQGRWDILKDSMVQMELKMRELEIQQKKISEIEITGLIPTEKKLRVPHKKRTKKVDGTVELREH